MLKITVMVSLLSLSFAFIHNNLIFIHTGHYNSIFFFSCYKYYYRQVSDISCTLEGKKIVNHSDVVGASPVGAAPTTSSFST